MADALRFHPLVAEDIRLASQWYDKISVDLGNRFRRAVDSRLDTVELRRNRLEGCRKSCVPFALRDFRTS